MFLFAPSILFPLRPVIVSAFWTKRLALFRRFGRKIREKLLRRGSRESSRVATKTWRLFITAARLSTKATAKMPLTNGNREWADILGARLLGFSIGSTFSSMRTRSLILLQSLCDQIRMIEHVNCYFIKDAELYSRVSSLGFLKPLRRSLMRSINYKLSPVH